METNDKKYEKLIKDLKNLHRINAPANFEADLKRRINSEKYKNEEKSIFKKVFLPSRLIPSLGLATAAIVVFLVVNVNSEEMDNPFLIEPRLREDIVEVKDLDSFDDKIEGFKKEQPVTRRDKDDGEKMKSLDKSETTERDFFAGREEASETEAMIEQPPVVTDEGIVDLETTSPESTLADISGEIEATETTSEMATGLAITKEELNFRQVQLSEKEQQKVDELKMKVQSLQNVKTEESTKKHQQ
jgi:hypothetical protein